MYDRGNRTGRRATVALTIEVLVEVQEHEHDFYHSVVETAKDEVRKRVVESPVFLPVSIKGERLYADVTVQELKSALIVDPKKAW